MKGPRFPELPIQLRDLNSRKHPGNSREISGGTLYYQEVTVSLLSWVVYKQFPGIRGELQGGVLDGFDLTFC